MCNTWSCDCNLILCPWYIVHLVMVTEDRKGAKLPPNFVTIRDPKALPRLPWTLTLHWSFWGVTETAMNLKCFLFYVQNKYIYICSTINPSGEGKDCSCPLFGHCYSKQSHIHIPFSTTFMFVLSRKTENAISNDVNCKLLEGKTYGKALGKCSLSPFQFNLQHPAY